MNLSMYLRVVIYIVLLVTSSQLLAAEKFTQDAQPDFGSLINFKASELCQVAVATNGYINTHQTDSKAVHAGEVIAQNLTLLNVQQTLNFICKTYREDVRAGRNSRLHNRDFLVQNFKFIRWTPDKAKAMEIAANSTNEIKSRMLNNIPQQQLFLTKYYTKLLDASPVKTDKYTQALYQLPFDEQAYSLEQAEQHKAQLTRFKFTRQQVIQGALIKNNLAKPLVWITEEALHDVLLQGTGVLNVEGQIRYFNVHRNNGIAYDYSIGKREQARYWYFAEVPSILGYGKEIDEKIAIRPHVTLAGNVKQLGLGKLMLLSYNVNRQKQSRLAILADEGGAFDDNLFQLDLLVDSYRGWSDYHQANKHLPDYADVWILVKKTEVK